jgi:hypothetical protein
VRLPDAHPVGWPIAESGCRRTSVPAMRVPEAERPQLVRQRGALPIVESGCPRYSGWADSAALPGAALPDAAEGAARTAFRHAARALEPGPRPVQPGLPNSARWNCPRMSDPATAVLSGPQRRARPKVSGPLRWSEVCESYRSPEQQCCHRTRDTFLEKSQIGLHSGSRLSTPSASPASPFADY